MSTAKHLALQKFEAIDMSFCDSVALLPRESRVHGSIITRNPMSKAGQLSDPTRFGTSEPMVKILSLTLFEQGHKILAQVVGHEKVSGCLRELFEPLFLLAG